MKSKNKHLSLFLVFLTILMISVPSFYTRKSRDVTDTGFSLENSQVSWNVSEYINFTGPPIDTTFPNKYKVFRIFIDDNDPNYNWSKTAAENEWCSGSGVTGDPYIIEGLYIDAQGEGGGIYIENSDRYFVVRDCWVNNSGTKEHDAGVLVQWSENGIIENNIFSNIKDGVWVQTDCHNISVSRNYMISDPSMYSRAFQSAGDCSNINVSGNVIVNFYSGMYLSDVTNITLSHNYIANFIFEEWEDPPVWFYTVNNSEVIYNTLDGVYAKTEFSVEIIGGMNNTVYDNKVVSTSSVNVPEIPILINVPKLHALDTRGFSLQDCYNNLIAHNIMLGGDTDSGIPGYDTLLTLSLAGIVFTALVIRIYMKKVKR